MLSTSDLVQQPITGIVPPQLGEATIRVAWPSVSATPAVATLGRKLILSIALAPLGWGLMLPFYFRKILPFLAMRYTLTNRRLMIQRGLKPQVSQEVALADIDEVRVVRDANSVFFRSGDLEIVSKGAVKLRLAGVPEPDAFRQAVLNSCMAWVPGKAQQMLRFVPSKV
ncbi:MAG: PH domain-containing protein [Planctomycetia bacterium]|nr:PH domain-containing protein [Planctomycetia bacterium]